MDVLSEAVERANKDHVDIRPLTNGLGRAGERLSEKQLRRYLEDRDPPPGNKIDQWAQVIATVTGEHDYLVYWDKAIKRAKDARAPVGGSDEADAAAATAAARRADEVSAQDAPKSPRKPSPKPRKRRAG